MPILVQVVLAVVSLALSYLLRPKIPTATSAASTPGEVDMPTVSEGTPIPVFFGVVWSSDSNVVWWGDTEVETRTYEKSA